MFSKFYPKQPHSYVTWIELEKPSVQQLDSPIFREKKAKQKKTFR